MFSTKSFFRFPVILLLLLCASCIKDVDVEQAGDIVIPPTAALDLIYFTIDSSSFYDQNGSFVAVDETRLEFLDDDYIQDGLVRADFNFQYINHFEKTITNTIYFLSEANRVMYTIKFDIPPGTNGEPNRINYTEIIKDDKINTIKKSIKMRVELEMKDASGDSEGELQLKSRAYYKFEFK